MKNKVLVKIYGRDYLLATEESQGYSDRLADTLNEKLRKVMNGKSELSRLDGAMLVALEAIDEAYKNHKSIDNIRGQINSYVEAADKARAELEKVKKETAEALAKAEEEKKALEERCKTLEEQGRIAVQNASKIAAGTNLYMDKSNKQTEQIRELNTRLTTIEAEKATMNAAMKRIENEKTVLDGAMRKLESENKSLNEAIDKYEQGSALFMDKADKLESENNTLKESLKQAERENAFLKEKVSQLEAEKAPTAKQPSRVTLAGITSQNNGKGNK